MDLITDEIKNLLTEIDLIWIETILKWNKQQKPVSEWTLIVELTDLLPNNFSTDKLYYRLFVDHSK